MSDTTQTIQLARQYRYEAATNLLDFKSADLALPEKRYWFNSVARVILDDGHFAEQIKAYETDPVFWKLEHDGKDLAEYWGCLALETTKQ